MPRDSNLLICSIYIIFCYLKSLKSLKIKVALILFGLIWSVPASVFAHALRQDFLELKSFSWGLNHNIVFYVNNKQPDITPQNNYSRQNPC